MSAARAMLAICILATLLACRPQPADADADAHQAVATPAPSQPARAAPAPAPAESKTPSFVLPGVFHPDMRLADVQAAFGAANVRAGEVPGAEGESAQGAVLFPDDPQRRAYLYYAESAPERIESVHILDQPTRWSLDSGVRPGMPLKDLVALNGKPIVYSGLDWDYGGAIVSYGGGKLAPAASAALERDIRLTSIDATGAAGDDGYPMGEEHYSSDDPRYPRQGERVAVGEIGVSFPAPAPR